MTKYIAILFTLFMLIFAGCATTMTDMDLANAKCAKNGGVAVIQVKYNSTIRVTCRDGAKFTITQKGNNL